MSNSGYNIGYVINPYGNGSGIMREKPLELSLYAAGAGAFGVFLRWMEDQLAFNEEGLADPSAFHFLLAAFLLACLVVFWRFIQEIDRKRYEISPVFQEALFTDVKLQTALSFLAGFVMALGALMTFAKIETDQYVGMLRLLSGLALLSGLVFPLVLREARREKPRFGLLCPMMLAPMFTYAVWLILSYRRNAINSVPLAYGMDMLTAIVSMSAYFNMAGFAFGGAKPKRALLLAMLSCTICIMSLADLRYTGMQFILLATAGQMLLYVWILLRNLKERERKVIVQKDDGFEHLR